MIKTRFDLEQEIMSCWHVVDDIKAVFHASDTLTEDELQNALLGISALYQIKFDRLMNTFEECIRAREV